jgi:hypothetical protein
VSSDPLLASAINLHLNLDIVAVFRTPGGRTHKLPSTVLAVDAFTGFKDILIIHHTGTLLSQAYILVIILIIFLLVLICQDCGITHMEEPVIRAELSSRVGPEHKHEVDALEFPFFKE